MRRRRDNPPVLAQLGGAGSAAGRVWALGRSDLEALGGVLGRVGDSAAVLVTGSEQGVGAVAVGLAGAATAAGQRVVLVECELARPRLAAVLGLNGSLGLRDYLRGDAEAGQVLQSLVPAGPASHRALDPLVFIAAGSPTEQRDELLASEGFAHAVGKLRHAYDLVVLAGPWLDAGEGIAAVSAQADAALVCVPPARLSGRSGRSVWAAARWLSAPVAGAVLVGEA